MITFILFFNLDRYCHTITIIISSIKLHKNPIVRVSQAIRLDNGDKAPSMGKVRFYHSCLALRAVKAVNHTPSYTTKY